MMVGIAVFAFIVMVTIFVGGFCCGKIYGEKSS